MMLRACIFAAAAFAALSSAAAQTPVMAVTPGGIPFAHAHLPKKANQLIAYGWRDGTALGGGAKAAAGQVAAQWISRGTLTRSAGEIDELLKDVAGSSGLFSGLELLTGSVQAPAAGFAEAVEIAADILANPAFPERALLRIKRGYAERARQGAENNASIADRMLSGLAVSDRNFLRIWSQTDGALADSISRADVEAWRAAVMGLDKVVVASAGPLPAAEAGALIDKLFQGLPRTSSAPAANPPAFTRSQKFVLLEKGGPQSIVRMGGISGWKPGLRAFEAGLAAGILGGGGFESRLTRAIREKLGATYGINAGHSRLIGESMGLTISSAVAHDKLAEVLPALKEEYQRFVAEGVTQPEFDAAKLRMRTAILNGREEPSFAATMRDNIFSGFGIEATAKILANLEALTRDELNLSIKANFPPWPLATAVVTPQAVKGFGFDCLIKTAADAGTC